MNKNKPGRLFITILLCLPVIIAVVVGLRIDPFELSGGTLKSIEVVEDDQKRYTFDDTENLKVYLEVCDTASEIEYPLRDISEDVPVTMIFTEQNGEQYTYKFYLTTEGKECYFEKIYATGEASQQTERKFYAIDNLKAEQLLLREEFYCVYPNSAVPVVTVSSSNGSITQHGDSVDWNWRRNDGNKITVAYENMENSDEVLILGNATDYKLDFSIQPDDVKYSYNETGAQVMLSDDDFAHLVSKIVYENDKDVEIKVSAKWYPNEQSDYYGEATYIIKALYDIPSTVELKNKRLPHGGFDIIYLDNFNDDEQLVIESPLSITHTPVMEYQGQKFAYVMIGCENPIGTSSMTINGKKFSFEVKEPKDYSTAKDVINITDPSKKDANTKETWKEYEQTVIPVLKDSPRQKLWTDKFVAPLEKTEILLEFGKNRLVSSLTAEYRHEAIDYAAKEGDTVFATNGGNVVFAGDTKVLGKLIVIDHGYSIYSYYGHLSEIDCAVGDTVEKKQAIGKCGSTGFALQPQLHFAMSIDQSFIEPIHVSGISFPN